MSCLPAGCRRWSPLELSLSGRYLPAGALGPAVLTPGPSPRCRHITRRRVTWAELRGRNCFFSCRNEIMGARPRRRRAVRNGSVWEEKQRGEQKQLCASAGLCLQRRAARRPRALGGSQRLGMGLGGPGWGPPRAHQSSSAPWEPSCSLHPPAAAVQEVSLLGKGASRGRRQSHGADLSSSRCCFHAAAAGEHGTRDASCHFTGDTPGAAALPSRSALASCSACRPCCWTFGCGVADSVLKLPKHLGCF